MYRLSLLLFGVACLWLDPIPALADNSQLRGRYFLQVWSYESLSNRPKDSHTFATLYSGDDLAAGRTAPTTISWLPKSGVVQPLRISKGQNFSLAATLSTACESRKVIRTWGPYEITAELYRRAQARVRLLESGGIKYGELGLGPKVMNCIEATGDLMDTPFNPGPVWGSKASRAVVRHLSPLFRDGTKVNTTVAELVRWPGCR